MWFVQKLDVFLSSLCIIIGCQATLRDPCFAPLSSLATLTSQFWYMPNFCCRIVFVYSKHLKCSLV